jgi:hypothetical protein
MMTTAGIRAPEAARLRSPLSIMPAAIICPDVSATLTTAAFWPKRLAVAWDRRPIAEPEGRSSISSTAQRRLDRRCS